jgi:hypothetical protein
VLRVVHRAVVKVVVLKSAITTLIPFAVVVLKTAAIYPGSTRGFALI